MKKSCVKKIIEKHLTAAFKLYSENNKKIFSTSAGISLACCLIVLLIAFPTNKYNPLVQVSAQRSTLDNALKQVVSGQHSNTGTGNIREITSVNRRLASISVPAADPADINNFNSSISETGIASFPYVYPVMGPRKSSGYGFRVHPIRGFSTKHKGIDLAAPVGASIRAMSKGRVIFADPYAGYGKLVVIDHGHGVTTHYAHCDRLTVHIGEVVETGQMIAEVGSTGMSTGPHLHLEVRINGQPLNPEAYFVGLADKAEG